MSLSRLFLGRLVSTRAHLRFTGRYYPGLGSTSQSTTTLVRVGNFPLQFRPAKSEKACPNRVDWGKNEFVLASPPLAGFEVTFVGRF